MYIDKKIRTENTKRIKDIMGTEGYIISTNVRCLRTCKRGEIV